MTYKFACLNSISPIGLKNFTNRYEQVSELSEANGILVRSAAMHDMEFSDNLYAIARAGAGVNNIPLQKCAEKGIVVFNTPGANANGVKELVFAGMLLASRDIVEGVDWVRANKAKEDIAKIAEKEKKKFAGTELQGKKLGIIGLGAIGVRVANAAVSLGMDVYGYDPYVSVDSAWHLSRKITHVLNVDDIYKDCDFITIHVPLLDSTKHMIGKEAISKMKKGVRIINESRAEVVDDDAIIRAIQNQEPQKALPWYEKARAVYERELPAGDCRLGGLYNNTALVLTDLGRFDEAKALYLRALEIMGAAEDGRLEMAVTELNLADLAAASKGLLEAEDEIEAHLDRAEALLEAPGNPRSGYYAFVCEKCAPSFGYYGRFAYAEELQARAKRIYEGN